MARAERVTFSERQFAAVPGAEAANLEFPLDDGEFEDCTFGKLALNDRKLSRCRFFDCTFRDCDFTLSRFVDCAFVRSKFERCRLTGINWSEVEKLERVSFNGSQLNDTTFIGVKMDACDFSQCIARRASFRDIALKGVLFRGADLEGTEFVNADLRQADFRDATGYVISPRENRLEKARFSLPEATRLLYGLGIVLD
jgi:uncharacterized protein YjbI with pentapeptide repeats